jgi:hypothetical protein
MDTVAYALRAELAGETEQDGETVPSFQGGLLSIAGDDFDVREHLDQGDGVIVVPAGDHHLIGVLDVFPALKRVATPAGAEPISPYERRSTDELHDLASMRSVQRAGSLSRADLIDALDRLDVAQADGDRDTIAEITGAQVPAPAAAEPYYPPKPPTPAAEPAAAEATETVAASIAKAAKVQADTSIPKVLEGVGDDVAAARAALNTEKARGDDARPTLVEALEKIINNTQGA